MQKQVIVHLSDIHYDNTESSDLLLENLIMDLDEMKKEVGKYDLLVITGDCVDRGNMSYFDPLSKKLKKLLKKCGLTPKRGTAIVPGNHDVSHKNEWLNGLKVNHTADVAKMNEIIENDLHTLFREYNDFSAMYGSPENGIGVKDFKASNGLCTRVIFINSVWSTLTQNIYGQLVIGDKQLDDIKNELSSRKKVDFTIVCMHHPLDWFTYQDRKKLEDFFYNKLKVDFILHGHIHEANYDSIFNMDSSTNIFCTGISYTKTGEHSSRKDGMRYSIYEIDKDTKTVNVFLRSTNSKGKFVADNRLYSSVNKGGVFTVPIGNISECLMPLKTFSPKNRNNVFLNRKFVELLLDKEEKLFRYYCGLESYLETQILSKESAHISKCKKELNVPHPSKKLREEWRREFYKEQFEIYCMFILSNLNALFFERHNDVRILLRRYSSKLNQHVAIMGEGMRSSDSEIENTKNFTWGDGMIYRSYKCKSALLKSQNLEYHSEGNSKDVWKEYLTIAVGGVEVDKSKEQVPLFALNIATSSLENEFCLQALAMSSIYDKIQEVFSIYNVKAYDIVKLYED